MEKREKFIDECLEPFVLSLSDFQLSPIGHGTNCLVEEVKTPGFVCAAKRLQDIFVKGAKSPDRVIKKAWTQFVRECQLMSTLRHPNIVQFYGVAFFPGSELPSLLMERLLTSLHELLDQETDPTPSLSNTTERIFPLGLKCSILHNVASGLAYLHLRNPNPIIHRNLTAKKVLLNSGMVAKISDLGVARSVTDAMEASKMTKGPGDIHYMPPEATADQSKYNASIDIFSFGVLTIFTIGEKSPNRPLSHAYTDPATGLKARTELQRRTEYMQYVNKRLSDCGQLRRAHPLIRLIQQCLHDVPGDRLGIHDVLCLLEEARDCVGDEHMNASKLELIQRLVSYGYDVHTTLGLQFFCKVGTYTSRADEEREADSGDETES